MKRSGGGQQAVRASAGALVAGFVYPEEDGEPMGATPIHRDEIARLIKTLQLHFADRDDIYVSGDMMVYYRERDPRAVISPDVMVVFGVEKLPGGEERRVFVIPVEGAAPSLVIELTSLWTVATDLRRKRERYAEIGIPEYYLYDPTAEYLKPPLQALQLVGDSYQPMAEEAPGAFTSTVLGLRLELIEGRLRFVVPRTGVALLDPEERAVRAEAGWRTAEAERAAEAAARRVAEAERAAEAAARRAAEVRIAELEAELRRLRDDPSRP